MLSDMVVGRVAAVRMLLGGFRIGDGVLARWNRRCCGRSGTAVSAPAPEECFLLVSVARGILGGGRATRPPVGEWDPKLSGGGNKNLFFSLVRYFCQPEPITRCCGDAPA